MSLLWLLVGSFSVLAAAAAAAAAAGTTFVSAQNGSDSATCGATWATACASLYGAGQAGRGSEAQVASGVYSGPLNCGQAAEALGGVAGGTFECAVFFAPPQLRDAAFANGTIVAVATALAATQLAFAGGSSLAVLDNASLQLSGAVFDAAASDGRVALEVGSNATARVLDAVVRGFDVGALATGVAASLRLEGVEVRGVQRGIVVRGGAAVQLANVTVARARTAALDVRGAGSRATLGAAVLLRDGAGVVVRGDGALLEALAGLELRACRSAPAAADPLLLLADGARADLAHLLVANSTGGAAVGLELRAGARLTLAHALVRDIDGDYAVKLSDASAAVLTHVTVADNSATAFFVAASSLSLADSLVARNAGDRAGALEARVGADVSIADTRFFENQYELTTNQSAPAAGAILVHDSAVELKRCALDSNGRSPQAPPTDTDAAQQIRCVALAPAAARVRVGFNTLAKSASSTAVDALCSPDCDWLVQAGSSVGSRLKGCQ